MTRARSLVRGLVLPLVAALGLAGCGIVGGGGGGYEVTAYFSRGVALYEQGQVRVLGLPAGRVLDVSTEEACPVEQGGTVPCVRVQLRLDDDVDLPAETVHATLIPQSLIGERYVQLTPAYTDGTEGPTLESLDEDERVIPLSRTIVPVEPDEALAAVNEFLEDLNPDGLGRLIDNAEQALEGNGSQLGEAITGIADLVDTFAQRDDELAALVDNFDAFTQTLVTREGQIGEVVESFARTANVLAQERQNLEQLLASLAQVSVDGFDLVSEHAAELRTDLATLGELGQSLVANLDSIGLLLDSGPMLTDGLAGAVNTDLDAVNLVSSLGPLVGQVLNPALQAILGEDAPQICAAIDTIIDGDCIGEFLGGVLGGASAGEPVPTDVAPPRTPIDDVLGLLGSPLVPAPAAGAGADDRVADGAGALGRFLRDAAESLSGVGG